MSDIVTISVTDNTDQVTITVADGNAATITIGTVTALPAGATPTVTNSGTATNAILDFGIPVGALTTTDKTIINNVTSIDLVDLKDIVRVTGAAPLSRLAGIFFGTDGQKIILEGGSDTDTVYLDPTTLTNVKFQGGHYLVLGLGDTIQLMYSTFNALNKWIEISRSVNV